MRTRGRYPAGPQVVKTIEKVAEKGEDMLKVFDVTLDELANPSGPWADVLTRIREIWVGDLEDRAKNVRCGTVYVSEEDGNGKITISLRFPVDREEEENERE